jgi:hypothetical protein
MHATNEFVRRPTVAMYASQLLIGASPVLKDEYSIAMKGGIVARAAKRFKPEASFATDSPARSPFRALLS